MKLLAKLYLLISHVQQLLNLRILLHDVSSTLSSWKKKKVRKKTKILLKRSAMNPFSLFSWSSYVPRFSHKPLELLSSSISKPSSKQKVIHKSLSFQLFFSEITYSSKKEKCLLQKQPKMCAKEWQLLSPINYLLYFF